MESVVGHDRSSLGVILKVLPKRVHVLKLLSLLGTAARLITHHMFWPAPPQKFKVLFLVMLEREKPTPWMPDPFLFPVYESAPVHQWITSTTAPLLTLSLAPPPLFLVNSSSMGTGCSQRLQQMERSLWMWKRMWITGWYLEQESDTLQGSVDRGKGSAGVKGGLP